MRILVAIPHFFRARGADAAHGSEGDAPRRRLMLANTLAALHSHCGPRQALLHTTERCTRPANETLRADLDVVVCTTGDDHLLAGLPTHLCRHCPTAAEPRLLGYECHGELARGLGRYDYYCYLEDDIVLADPLFFRKLAWFDGLFGQGALLQPNRFEIAPEPPVRKLYMDGDLVDPAISPRFQDRRQQPRLSAAAMGQEMVFQRVDNPHSGCFFLTAAQMGHWAGQPWFLDRAADYWGPLESAATLGIMRSFRVYKPARENAGFLEVMHADRRYLQRRLRLAADPPHRF